MRSIMNSLKNDCEGRLAPRDVRRNSPLTLLLDLDCRGSRHSDNLLQDNEGMRFQQPSWGCRSEVCFLSSPA